jgi:hypothetical protein
VAQYDHGVKFDHPSHNDGFVSHVARRGAEKTSTAGMWLFVLILAGIVYGMIKGLAHALGPWRWVTVAALVALLLVYLVYDDRSIRRKRASSPWLIPFMPVDGVKVFGATRYRTKEEALAAGAKFKTVNVSGVGKPLRGYEVQWNGPTGSGSAKPDSSGFMAIVPQPATPKPAEQSPRTPAQRSRSTSTAPSSPSERPTATSPVSPSSRTSPSPAALGLVRGLKELGALHADGAISEAEFVQAKRRLLAGI